MEIIDTHAHLYDQAFSHELSDIIARSKQHHIANIYMPNLNLETLQPMLALAQTYPHLCKPMLGLHPCNVKDNFKSELEQLATWLPKHPFVAIGEVGIDLYHAKSTKKEQIQALDIQIQWAIDYKLPLILHARESLDELLPLLETKKHAHPELKGIMHCFTGTLQQAKKTIALGFYLGIGGIFTLGDNNPQKTILPHIGLKHIVLETDSPYLAPLPYRGQRNEPAHLSYIIQDISTTMNIPIQQIATITTANARTIFST